MNLEPIDVALDNPDQTIRSNLGGVDYLIRLDYHARSDRWFAHLSDANGVRLARGGMLVTHWPLFSGQMYKTGMPKGLLMPISFEPIGRADPPGFSDLGRRVLLCYLNPDTPTPIV